MQCSLLSHYQLSKIKNEKMKHLHERFLGQVILLSELWVAAWKVFSMGMNHRFD
jgi:hypothetical protein